jgi:tRNA threonylcarbamoyladenosine biosynthesis protein TsaE
LVKGIAEGLGAATRDEVTSPTYTLIHEYGDPVALYHADLYRLDTIEEARATGIEELIEAPALLVVEWGDRFPALWPANAAEIHITTGPGTERRFTLKGMRH